jgi:hypothetical protein
MLTWNKSSALDAKPLAVFRDTIESLVKIYLTHKDSPYHELRHHVQITYGRRLSYVSRDFGGKVVSELTMSDFKEMHRSWLAPLDREDKDGNIIPGKPRVSHAHEQMVFVRQAFRFGKALKLPGCRDAKDILDEMEFKNVGRRKVFLSLEQAILVINKAHEVGSHSIAATQALQACLGIRQKDAAGEWIPLSDPGMSDVVDGKWKWVMGFRFEELDQNFTLTHRLSKSVRGRDGLADSDAGKVKTWKLPLYPLIMEELARMAGVSPAMLTRDMLPASGPMIIAEHNGLPWIGKSFGEKWRKIARLAKIPDEVQNRDSRAGAGTDAELKGADIEQIRQGLGHSKPDTTRLYLRAEEEATDKVAVLRFGKKTP